MVQMEGSHDYAKLAVALSLAAFCVAVAAVVAANLLHEGAITISGTVAGLALSTAAVVLSLRSGRSPASILAAVIGGLFILLVVGSVALYFLVSYIR